jgi:hypothetical protein
VFTVTPVKVFAHAKGDPFGGTAYRFWPAPLAPAPPGSLRRES